MDWLHICSPTVPHEGTPRHKRGGVLSQSSPSSFTDSRVQEFQVERLRRVGSPCKGKSVSSHTPIVFGRLRHEVICWSQRVSSERFNCFSLKLKLKFSSSHPWKQNFKSVGCFCRQCLTYLEPVLRHNL